MSKTKRRVKVLERQVDMLNRDLYTIRATLRKLPRDTLEHVLLVLGKIQEDREKR